MIKKQMAIVMYDKFDKISDIVLTDDNDRNHVMYKVEAHDFDGIFEKLNELNEKVPKIAKKD